MALGLAVLGIGASLLGAVTTDVAVGGRGEVMGGVSPVVSGEPPTASFATAFSPLGAARVWDWSWHVSLRYSPRLYLRVPNPTDDGRPLVYHRATLEHGYDLSRTVTWRSDLDAAAGQVDYSVYQQGATPDAALRPGASAPGGVTQPGPGAGVPGGPRAGLPSQQGGVPPSGLPLSVLSLYDVSFDTSFRIRTSERLTLDLGAVLGDTGSLEAASNIYPHHQLGVFDPRLTYRLTAVDTLELPVTAEYHVVGGTKLNAETAELVWVHRESDVTGTRLGAGAVYSTRLDPVSRGAVRPMASAGATLAVIHEREDRLNLSLDLKYEPLLYVLTAEYRPIGTVLAGLAFAAAPHFRGGLRASFSTTLTSKPSTPGEVETYFLAEAPVIYQANRNLAFEVGARSLFSGPNLSEGFAVRDFQFWVYGAVTFAFATVDDPARIIQ